VLPIRHRVHAAHDDDLGGAGDDAFDGHARIRLLDVFRDRVRAGHRQQLVGERSLARTDDRCELIGEQPITPAQHEVADGRRDVY